MTAYMLGATVAHPMVFLGSGEWRSWCSRGPRFNAPEFYQHPESTPPLLHTADGRPALPWCSRCLDRVAELANEVGLVLSTSANADQAART